MRGYDITIEVVKDLVVRLPPQEDVCNTLSYTPQNFDSKFTYKIDGATVTNFPKSLVVRPTQYIVTAEYKGLCAAQIVSDTFLVKNIQSAKFVIPKTDTTICESNVPLTLKPAIKGGVFSGSIYLKDSVFTPITAGVYPITYTIGKGTCLNSESIRITVVKELVVTLPPQDDVCGALSYKPQNYDPKITYRIGGTIFTSFPTNLPVSSTPYIVTAEYKGLCGNQLKADTFLVSNIQSAKFVLPKTDTTVCESNTPITLKTIAAGGVFSGSSSLTGNIFTPNTAGVYVISYTIGKLTCKNSESVKITVVKELVVTLGRQDDVCNSLSYNPQNFDPRITYRIGGNVVSSFPANLPVRSTPYIVTAEYKGLCGNQLKADTFLVSNIQSAKILIPKTDTTICQSTTPITLKAEVSGGVFSGTTALNGSVFTPDKVGDFDIKYTVGKGTCENSTSVKIKVVKDLIVTLPAQEDVCNALTYSPGNFDDKITYKINDTIVTKFPVILPIRPKRYRVQATYSGVCGNQLQKDSFFVSVPKSAKIIFPKNDTIVCQGSSAILLKPEVAGGTFSGSTLITGDIFNPSSTGEFYVKYSIGKGTCEKSDSVKIKVVKDLVVTLPTQEDVCNPLKYTPGNFDDRITYKINDTIVKKFPITLPVTAMPYRVEASFSGVCGNQIEKDVFLVSKPQSAKIIFPIRDTVICEGSEPILLKSEVAGGNFSGSSTITGNIFSPTMRGDYVIKYTIGKGTCESNDSLKIKVVKDLVVSLPQQDDVCNPLNYSPLDFDSRITYKINDSIVKVFPIKLSVGTKPYVVKASFSGVCGEQEKIDSFWVREPEKLQFLNPQKDTSICLSTMPLKITANVLGGTWTGNDIAQDGAFLPSSAADYTLGYSIGSGTCKVDKSLKINVQKATASVKSMVLCKYTPITQIVASPVGGKFYSIDCPTCIDSTGLFNVKNLGDSTKALVYYNYKNPLGCSGVFSADIEVENPIADFKVSKACEGEPVSIEFNNTKAKSVEWYLDGNLVDLKSINNLSYGPHKIKLVAKSTYCENTLEKTLNVVNKPRLTKFDFLLSSVCSPADVTFNPKPSLQPNMNYFWDFGRTSNDTLSIFQPPVIKYDTKTYTISTLKVGLRTYNECGSLFFDTSFQLKSLPLPRIQLDSSKVGCSPYEVTLTNRSLGEIDSCYWDFGNGKYYKRCDNFVRTTYVTPDSTKIFKPVLYTYNICGVKSDTAQIKVTPPGIRAFFNTDKYLICPFDTIPFVDASTPKPEKYAWFFGDGGVSQISNPFHVFTKSDSIFKITLRAYGKCGYDTISHTIKTKVAPPVNFQIPNYGCEDKVIIVKNLSPANLWKYKWTTSDGAVYDNKYDLEHIFKSGNQKEIVTLKVTNFEGCTNELAREIPIKEKPLADFDVVNPKGCTPQRIHFINKSKNADSYIWYFGDSSTTKIENPYHAYIKNGSYDVKLIALYDNNCIDSTLKINFVYIYDCNCYVPNIFSPNGDGVNDIFTVYSNDAIDKIEIMEIFDRWGDKVYEGSEINAIGNGWDGYLRGVLATEGVYTYRLIVRYKDGSKKAVKGDVTLMY